MQENDISKFPACREAASNKRFVEDITQLREQGLEGILEYSRSEAIYGG